jgi:hypothetical protein
MISVPAPVRRHPTTWLPSSRVAPRLARGAPRSSPRGQNFTHRNVTAIALESVANISLTET